MMRVIIESPYAGDIERNVEYARRAVRDSLSWGEAPIASHLLYTQPGILDDNVPAEREWGINAGLAWADVADLAIFYVDYGWSRGMEAAKRHHLAMDVPCIQRTIGPNPPRNGSSQNPSKSSPEQPNPIDNV